LDGGFNIHCRQNFLSETLRGHLIVNGFAHLREMPDQKLQDPGYDGWVPKQRAPVTPQQEPFARGNGVQPQPVTRAIYVTDMVNAELTGR
jgi:hypothetical protein